MSWWAVIMRLVWQKRQYRSEASGSSCFSDRVNARRIFSINFFQKNGKNSWIFNTPPWQMKGVTLHCYFFAFAWINIGEDNRATALLRIQWRWWLWGTRWKIRSVPYGCFGIRFISATKDFCFAVISTHVGRKPLRSAFLTDFKLDHAAQ